jgi:mannosyltransferase
MHVEERRATRATWLLAGLIAIGLLLRFWRLGDWNFEATEIFTLRDSIEPRFSRNPRPLIYFLNYYVVRPFAALDEFGLRLLPAIFGVLAIPTFYFVSRRLVGIRAALFGTLLLTFSPLHIFYSQFARYWSLVFLLSAVYPYAIYVGIREGNRRALALGILTGVLAVLAHPVSILLLGGLGIWLVATYLRSSYLASWWNLKQVRWGALVGLIVLVVIAARFVPVLYGWISMHDNKAPEVGQFLLHPPIARGLKQIFFLVNFVESLTVPVVLTAMAGIYVLWKERDRPLATVLTYLSVFQVAFITLLSLRTPVSTFYLLPAVPAFYVGAGVFLDRLLQVDWKLQPRWLLPATIAAAILAAGAPTLVSQYRNGRRFDFRTVAQWLQRRLTPEDVIYSDQPMVLAHYLPGTKVQKLRHNPAPLQESVHLLRQSRGSGALWIVAPAPAHAFRTNLKPGGLANWMYANCQLRNTIGVGRVDFRQQYLQVYRCPSAGSSSTEAENDSAWPTGFCGLGDNETSCSPLRSRTFR